MRIMKIFRGLVWVVVLMTAQTGHAVSWVTTATDSETRTSTIAFSWVLADISAKVSMAIGGGSQAVGEVLDVLNGAEQSGAQDDAALESTAAALASPIWVGLVERGIELQFVAEASQALLEGVSEQEKVAIYRRALNGLMLGNRKGGAESGQECLGDGAMRLRIFLGFRRR